MDVFKITLLGFYFLSVSVSAADSSIWTLTKDSNLNGVVENGVGQELDNEVLFNKFNAVSDSSSSKFMGEFIEAFDTSVIRFQEMSDSEVLSYIGVKRGEAYQGTWNSTNGDAGDFGLGIGSSSGGTGNGPYFPLNIKYIPEASEGVVLSGDNNETATADRYWYLANTAYPVTSGKWYWEVEFKGDNGSNPSGPNFMPGVSNTNTSYWSGAKMAAWNPANREGYCFSTTQSYYGESVTVQKNDVVSVMLDMDSKSIAFALNGVSVGVVCSGLPDTVYPALGTYSRNITETNFGQFAWKYPELTQ